MKATLRVDIKGDGTSVAFDFELSEEADRARFKAMCGLLARPEVTGESRERFLRQIVMVVDDIAVGKVPGHPSPKAKDPSPFIKTAHDVAIDRAGKHAPEQPRQDQPQPARPALDLSELMKEQEGRKKIQGK